MLATLRGGLNKWYARLFFGFLVLLFVAWGVGSDLLNLISGSSDTAAAHVGARSIEMPELQDAYRRQLAQVTQQLGRNVDPTPEIRSAVLQQVLTRLITQSAMTQAATRDGLVAPDDAQRQAVYAIPAFHGPDGKFSRDAFEQALRNNNLTEARFLGLVSQDLLDRQFTEPLRSGAIAPDVLVSRVYAFQHEQRTAAIVELPFAAAAEPAAPSELQLARWYENHKDSLYSTPEMRRIKLVVLSPETVAKDIQVTDEELQTAWEQAKDRLSKPETRAAEVVLLSDQAKAEALVKFWQGNADWTAVRTEAGKDGGSPIDLPASARDQIPSPELAAALFSAAPNQVGGPVQTALGWYAFRVTAVTPAQETTFAEAKPELTKQVIAAKATDIIYDRANKIDDLLSGGVTLDSLPGDLGLAAASGSMDAEGNTAEGTPAPIPGDQALREAVVQAVFAAKPGEPPHLLPVGENGTDGFFAFALEDIVAPAPKPQAAVADKLRADWIADARRTEQNEAATAIMTAVKSGQDLAAAAAGREVRTLEPASRIAPARDMPAQLLAPLFTLKQGEPTMVETPSGFVVAVLTKIAEADPAADPIGYGQIRDALSRALGDDVEITLATAVRERATPRINRTQIDNMLRQND